MVDKVLREVGLYNDTTAREHANTCAELAYENLYNAFDWTDAKSVFLWGVGGGFFEYYQDGVIVMPRGVERIQAAVFNYNRNLANDSSSFVVMNPSAWDASNGSGDPTIYTVLSPSSASYDKIPVGDEKEITIRSDSDSDVGVVVSYTANKTGDSSFSSTATLDGTNPVSIGYWNLVSYFSKPETAGRILVSADGDDFFQLEPKENSVNYLRVKLNKVPAADSNASIMFLVRNRFPGFKNDCDSVKIPAINQAVIATLKADMLEYKEDFEKAAIKRNDANSFFMQAVANERLLGQYDVRVGVENPCVVGARTGNGSIFKT